MVSIGLSILAAGLSLSITGAFNVILLSVPIQVTGIALGMTLLLNLVGMSVGPAIAGIFQQMNQGAVQGVPGIFRGKEKNNTCYDCRKLTRGSRGQCHNFIHREVF